MNHNARGHFIQMVAAGTDRCRTLQLRVVKEDKNKLKTTHMRGFAMGRREP